MNVTHCRICGGTHFVYQPVLWPELISDWQLSAKEAEYIDHQQGKRCTHCGANLRSIALACALTSSLPSTPSHPAATELLANWVQHPSRQTLSLLEINEAGTLSPYLRQLPLHQLGQYPELDLCALTLPDASFDAVVHSDTLEHIPNPVKALQECYRVLKPGGVLCMTTPLVVGRMTRSRFGLPPSYHSPDKAPDYIVHTEFGADAWTSLMDAGFSHISMHAVEYPAALAFCAYK